MPEYYCYIYILFLKLNVNSKLPTLIDCFGYSLVENSMIQQKLFTVVRTLFFNKLNTFFSIFTITNKVAYSLENVFLNLMWAERECSEMLGLIFISKNDTRNLLLQYFDISKPLLKSVTSLGDFELFFNAINNSIINIKLTIVWIFFN